MEWAKSHARAARWTEEEILVVEEMRQVLHFFMWHKNWWLDQSERREDATSDIREGLAAYAKKQADILQRLARRFAEEWYPFLTEKGLKTDWPEELDDGMRRMSKRPRI